MNKLEDQIVYINNQKLDKEKQSVNSVKIKKGHVCYNTHHKNTSKTRKYWSYP